MIQVNGCFRATLPPFFDGTGLYQVMIPHRNKFFSGSLVAQSLEKNRSITYLSIHHPEKYRQSGTPLLQQIFQITNSACRYSGKKGSGCPP
ncbi:MAG: hypothetical protein P8M80_07625, partial [Pirellulaceae bacterium]|nr:hypothetical protein [Pirellulaceae bacterium]